MLAVNFSLITYTYNFLVITMISPFYKEVRQSAFEMIAAAKANDVETFEGLYESLKKMVSDDVKTSQRQESIDFDNQYFYPILGLLVGSGIIWLMSLIINYYHQSYFRILLLIFMVFSLALAGYFVFTKPISKSHGLRFRIVDTVIGIVFLILWMGLLYQFLL